MASNEVEIIEAASLALGMMGIQPAVFRE
jgi:hypothetical protein